MTETDAALSSEEAVDYGHDLISSRRVEGTAVFDRDGRKLGTIHSVMIEKRRGQVAYAVLSFGGLFGFGEKVYPVPWSLLTYDVDSGGYSVDVERGQLADAPAMTLDDTDRPIDRDYQEQVHKHWGTMPWWGL
jgi:sporulation protein YlmC with PRC-barrel domain